jgi:hypothetical protein
MRWRKLWKKENRRKVTIRNDPRLQALSFFALAFFGFSSGLIFGYVHHRSVERERTWRSLANLFSHYVPSETMSP